MTTMSKATLATALLEFQRNAPTIPFDATNPHYKNRYPTLHGVFDAIRPTLGACDLVVSQVPTFISNGDGHASPALTTRITHAPSNEFIEGTMLLLTPKADPQGQGSALTYARRYAVLAMLGLVGDEDDDGQAVSNKKAGGETGRPAAPSGAPKRSTPAPPADIEFAPDLPTVDEPELFAPPGDGLTPKQNSMIGAMVTKLKNVEETRAWMDANLGKTSRASLTKNEASALIDWLKDQEHA